MTVVLEDGEARSIARLLGQYDRTVKGEYTRSGVPDARHWADELKERAGPPREPIRDWVKRKFDPENDDQLETLVDEVVAAIERHGKEQ